MSNQNNTHWKISSLKCIQNIERPNKELEILTKKNKKKTEISNEN